MDERLVAYLRQRGLVRGRPHPRRLDELHDGGWYWLAGSLVRAYLDLYGMSGWTLEEQGGEAEYDIFQDGSIARAGWMGEDAADEAPRRVHAPTDWLVSDLEPAEPRVDGAHTPA